MPQMNKDRHYGNVFFLFTANVHTCRNCQVTHRSVRNPAKSLPCFLLSVYIYHCLTSTLCGVVITTRRWKWLRHFYCFSFYLSIRNRRPCLSLSFHLVDAHLSRDIWRVYLKRVINSVSWCVKTPTSPAPPTARVQSIYGITLSRTYLYTKSCLISK